jgi:hypothetical protein
MSSADTSPRASVLRPGVSPAKAACAVEAPFDPLRLCVYTTIALLAWVLSPPVAVVWMATLGLIGFVKAQRAGRMRSGCRLRDARVVLPYLAIAWLAGAFFTVKEVVALLS